MPERKTVAGLVSDLEHARGSVRDLKAAGFDDRDIGLAMVQGVDEDTDAGGANTTAAQDARRRGLSAEASSAALPACSWAVGWWRCRVWGRSSPGVPWRRPWVLQARRRQLEPELARRPGASSAL